MNHRLEILINQLQSYTPTDRSEAQHRKKMIALCNIDQDPFSRSFYSPGHFTASAFVLSPDRHSLLLLFHKKLHRWLQPGGHIDPNDISIEDAAKRELFEEAGLQCPFCQQGIFDLDVHRIPENAYEPEHNHFDIRYLFQSSQWTLTPEVEGQKIKWFPFHQILEGTPDKSIKQVLEKIIHQNNEASTHS